ncbi:hypothetical protein BROUX41_002712 [Berkeleyomyces rouxiae]|uniref:uncharacterized protein n=1 Tax=Berkeleyomyces rouxiae TaxID=2035830 RepID=UPI003B799E1F
MEVSSTRLYLGNLPRTATKDDVQTHFARMAGEITDIKLMNGFGFIEYKDPMDARDVVPAFRKYSRLVVTPLTPNPLWQQTLSARPCSDRAPPPPPQDGTDFMGERLTVQFARGSRHRDPNNGPGSGDRNGPRPRRTPHRMQISGLPEDTSWQDLKDFARHSGLHVIYSEMSQETPGQGFVEFETEADLRDSVEKLTDKEFRGKHVTCVADPQPDHPAADRDFRGRSRSPMPRTNRYARQDMGPGSGPGPGPGPSPNYGPHGGHYGHGPMDDFDRRGPMPPRGYSPRRERYRDPYRDRSPPRRDYYDDRRSSYRSPPRRPPMDDYERRPYEDPYRRDYSHPPDPYGRPPMYDRPPRDYPPRDGGYPHPPRNVYPTRDYDRGRYW